MKTSTEHLLLEQLENKMSMLSKMEEPSQTTDGWVKTVRTALNMSLRQLATKLRVTPQNVKKLEQGEREGSISLKKLKEMADALDMILIYALIPKEGSLEKLVEKKASQKAREIVMRTSQTMSLEAQENSELRLRKAIQQKTEMIMRELPKYLWD